MRVIGRHAKMPIVLLLAGVSLFVYGVGYHARPVLMPEEADGTADAPPEDHPAIDVVPEDPLDGAPMAPMFGDAPPPPPPPPPAEPILVAMLTPELDLIRDVTVGGVIRLDTGELKRTYAGAPPSLCPT